MNRIVLPHQSLVAGIAGLMVCYGLPASHWGAQAAEPDEALSSDEGVQPHPVPSITVETVAEQSAARSLSPVRPIPATPAPPAIKLDASVSQAPPPLDVPEANGVPENALPSPTTGKNSYVDRSSYGSFDRTELPPLLPPAIDLTERSTGCQTTLVNGQLVRATCQSPTGLSLPAPPPPPGLQAPIAAGELPTVLIDGLSGSGLSPSQSVTGVASLPGLPPSLPKPKPAPPPRLNPANYVASALSAATNAIVRRSPKLKLPGNGDRAVLYPLANPGRISSLFGWRTHPIFGDRRFHSGTDIAAPHGTPVVAAYSGRVSTAGYLQGYGLTVILRHADDTQESRYAHLSEIFVRPGTWVAQGTEIGRVGSTGNSTGPHLHFEWRQREGSKWVAVDAGEHLGGDGRARGVVSLEAYRRDKRPDTGEPTDAIARADWYVLPAVPPISRSSARPLTLSLWARTGERATTTSASGFWPLSPAFITLLRWQPLQAFPVPAGKEVSGAPSFLVDRRGFFEPGVREFALEAIESGSDPELQ